MEPFETVSHQQPLALQVIEFLIPLKDKLPEVEGKKLDAAIGSLVDPRQCWSRFLEADRAGDGLLIKEEDDLEAEPAPAAPAEDTSPLDTLKAEFNKATGSMLDLILDLMRGKSLEDCRTLGAGNLKLPQAVSDAAKNLQGDNKSETSVTELVKAVCLVVQSFDTNAKSVSISAAAPAPSLITTLNSNADGGEDVADRERIWRLVQGERRKYITFSVVPKHSKEAMTNAFRQCGKVWSFSGQLNSSHRLITASADLMPETSAEPWLNFSPPATDVWKSVAEFCMGVTGSTDFSLMCDGRMREMRRIHAPCLLSLASCFQHFVMLSTCLLSFLVGLAIYKCF